MINIFCILWLYRVASPELCGSCWYDETLSLKKKYVARAYSRDSPDGELSRKQTNYLQPVSLTNSGICFKSMFSVASALEKIETIGKQINCLIISHISL